jgi:hypothetical protein
MMRHLLDLDQVRISSTDSSIVRKSGHVWCVWLAAKGKMNYNVSIKCEVGCCIFDEVLESAKLRERN